MSKMNQTIEEKFKQREEQRKKLLGGKFSTFLGHLVVISSRFYKTNFLFLNLFKTFSLYKHDLIFGHFSRDQSSAFSKN